MLIDARTLDRDARIEGDICVIGTGPAGLTLLKQLTGSGLRIVSLESGGRSFDADAQGLCDGNTVSPHNYPRDVLLTSRRRQLGGTANLWNDELNAGQGDELARLVELDEIDFETRAWVPYSGWPLKKSELRKFYDQALGMLDADRCINDGLEGTSDHPNMLQSEARLRTVLSRFTAATVFTRDWAENLARDNATSVYLNATLMELVVQDSSIAYARVASTPGREFRIAARFFVLAAGAVENARILLLSNRTQPNGLGNEHDIVGRFLMDHPSFRLGVLTPSNRNLFRCAGLYDHHLRNGKPVMGKFTFQEETMRQREMLNICVTLTPRGRDYESPATNALKAIIRSKSAAERAQLLRREFRTMTGNWDEMLARFYHKVAKTPLTYFESKGGWSRLPRPERRFRRFELCCLAEQTPNPENRITLADELDRFGQRRGQVRWRWNDADLRSIRTAQDILKQEFEQQRLGTFVRQYELDGGNPPAFVSPHHQMGTTRMHNDPRQGVVDRNSRVHGISNLYLTGTSVFTTGGFANPTLTIVALALRLSYHLEELMKAPSSLSTVAVPSSATG